MHYWRMVFLAVCQFNFLQQRSFVCCQVREINHPIFFQTPFKKLHFCRHVNSYVFSGSHDSTTTPLVIKHSFMRFFCGSPSIEMPARRSRVLRI